MEHDRSRERSASIAAKPPAGTNRARLPLRAAAVEISLAAVWGRDVSKAGRRFAEEASLALVKS